MHANPSQYRDVSNDLKEDERVLPHNVSGGHQIKEADATLQHRAAIQKDLARLEGWADRNVMIANKDKSKVPPLSLGSPLQCQRLQTAWLVFSSVYKALDCRYPGLYKQEHSQWK